MGEGAAAENADPATETELHGAARPVCADLS